MGQEKRKIHIVTMGNLLAGRIPTTPERMPRDGHSSGDLLFLLLPAGHRGEFSFPSCFSPFTFSSFPKSSYDLWSQCMPPATDPMNKSLHRSSCLNILHTTTWGRLRAAECQPAGGYRRQTVPIFLWDPVPASPWHSCIGITRRGRLQE